MQAFPPEPLEKLTRVGPLRVSLWKKINASGLLGQGQDPPLGGQITTGRGVLAMIDVESDPDSGQA